MKTTILILVGLLFTGQLHAQNPQPVLSNSVISQTITPTTSTLTAQSSTSTVVNTTISPSPCNTCRLDSIGVQINQNGTYFFYPNKTNGWQILLVFLPVLLFGFVLFMVAIWLRRSGFKLADMLSENEPTEISVENPDPEQRKTLPFIPKKILIRSASRLVAFLSGLCTVALATCTTSYFFYIYVKTGRAPDLNNLFDILLALGMGVVPYAVNKVTTALK